MPAPRGKAPDEYVELYPESYRADRRWYAGMTSYWDAALGNITALVKRRALSHCRFRKAATEYDRKAWYKAVELHCGVTTG